MYIHESADANTALMPAAINLCARSHTNIQLLLTVPSALTAMQLLASPVMIWLQSVMLACQAAICMRTEFDGRCRK